MKRRHSMIIAHLVGMCALAFYGVLLADEESDPYGARVDALMADWADASSPGAAIGVVKNGEVVFSSGYGVANLEYGIPITSSTVFNIGSMAKQFTAYASALLVDRGELSLDDDVRIYMPEVPNFGSPIRIRHLIGHTSGLREYYDLLMLAGWTYHDVITPDHVLNLVSRQQRLNFETGADWLYCNTGYSLLAEVIARVTGQSFASWMAENVFEPLDMSDTRFPSSLGMLIKNRAYSYNYISSEPGEQYEIDVLSSEDVGCTNLWITLDDMFKWVKNMETFALGGPSVGHLISQRAVLNNGGETDYAFGQFVGEHAGYTTLSHSGKIAGYRSYLIRIPEQSLAVVVLCNASWISPTMVGRQVVDIYLSEATEPESRDVPGEMMPSEDSPEPVYLRLPESVLQPYVGHYKLESGKLLEVAMGGEHLLLFNLSLDPFELLPLSESLFEAKESRLKISFALDGKGSATQLEMLMGPRQTVAVRVELPDLSSEDRAVYTGVYYSDEASTHYKVVDRDGVLLATHGKHPDTELVPLGNDEFQGTNRWLRMLNFERDLNGDVVAFSVSYLGAKDVLFRKIVE